MNYKLFYSVAVALALCTASCSDEEQTKGSNPSAGNSNVQYVVCYSSGEDVGYLMQVDDIKSGILNGMANTNNRQQITGEQDYVPVSDKYLYNINYVGRGSTGASTVSSSWKLDDNNQLVRRQDFVLEGEVKARGIFNEYLIGTSSLTEEGKTYERVKIVDTEKQSIITKSGYIDTNPENSAVKDLIPEHILFSDIAQYGEYVLISYTTRKEAVTETQDAVSDLANNTYVGVYKLDINDTVDNEYLKFKHLISRESTVEKPAGQIKGSYRWRIESGIEPVDNGDIYFFCQAGSTKPADGDEMPPSAVLKISKSRMTNGMPEKFDDDYYVNLHELSGNRRLWRCYYLGETLFCLQFYTKPENEEGTDKTKYKLAIFDASTSDFKWVENMPSDITDMSFLYMVEKENKSITFGIETESQKPALYTVSQNAVMTRGLEVNAEHINGVIRLKR